MECKWKGSSFPLLHIFNTTTAIAVSEAALCPNDHYEKIAKIQVANGG